MGEAKLAINNLFNRISGKGQNKTEDDMKNTTVITSPSIIVKISTADAAASSEIQAGKNDSNNSERSISEKLNAIQDRIMDMSAVVQKVEQFMAKEKEKAKG